MSDVELVWDVQAELGEGPVWDAARGVVWFVDIKGRKLHRYDPATGGTRSWDTPDQTGFALPAEDGSLICGVRGGLHRFDPDRGDFSRFQPVEEDQPQNRLNDGYAAPDGALWFGSMDDSEQRETGALYRWFRGELTRHDDGYGVTNGPCLSPDGRTLYHHDTLKKTILAFDHDEGAISNRRVFAVTEDGYADGPSMDADGVLHVGLFNGWGVARFSPQGERIGKITAPVQTVTKAAFGGGGPARPLSDHRLAGQRRQARGPADLGRPVPRAGRNARPAPEPDPALTGTRRRQARRLDIRDRQSARALMSVFRPSLTKTKPSTAVSTAIATGYQRP